MKSIDACKWFVPFINDAISEGYTPVVMTDNSFGSRGCQVWQRGNDYITLWADEQYGMDVEGVNSVNVLTLSVARFTVPMGTSLRSCGLDWCDKWEKHIVASKTMYDVDATHRDRWWVEDIETVRRARDTRYERLMARRTSCVWRELPLTDELLAIVRRVKGFKTVDSRHITVTKKLYESTWWITNTKSGNYVCKSCDRYREW